MSAAREDIRFRSLGEELVAVLILPEGAGPFPVLLVSHGAGEFKENYFELAEHLAARGIATLAVDMHGHGQSGGTPFQVKMTEWVADLVAAVDFLSRHPRIDSKRIAAFGLSSGGTAILEAALIEPRLKALVALDATVRNTLPFVATTALQMLIAVGHVKRLFTGQDLRINLLKLMSDLEMASDPEINQKLRSNPGKLKAFMSFPLPGATESFFVDTIKRVGGIKIPTLVIWGEDDKLDPPESGRVLHAALQGKKRLEIVPGNGHVGHLDRHREKVFALTAEWLNEHL